MQVSIALYDRPRKCLIPRMFRTIIVMSRWLWLKHLRGFGCLRSTVAGGGSEGLRLRPKVCLSLLHGAPLVI